MKKKVKNCLYDFIESAAIATILTLVAVLITSCKLETNSIGGHKIVIDFSRVVNFFTGDE